MLLRLEVEVEGALRDVGGGHDLVDAGGGDALGQEDALGRVEELFTPDLGRLGARPGQR